MQEANAKFDQDALQEMELAPVQRKIEARSAEDSFTGFVRTLYFADTFLRDSEYEKHLSLLPNGFLLLPRSVLGFTARKTRHLLCPTLCSAEKLI